MSNIFRENANVGKYNTIEDAATRFGTSLMPHVDSGFIDDQDWEDDNLEEKEIDIVQACKIYENLISKF